MTRLTARLYHPAFENEVVREIQLRVGSDTDPRAFLKECQTLARENDFLLLDAEGESDGTCIDSVTSFATLLFSDAVQGQIADRDTDNCDSVFFATLTSEKRNEGFRIGYQGDGGKMFSESLNLSIVGFDVFTQCLEDAAMPVNRLTFRRVFECDTFRNIKSFEDWEAVKSLRAEIERPKPQPSAGKVLFSRGANDLR